MYGPYGPYAGNKKPVWIYQAYGFENAQHVVALMWKWLSPVKRQQAKVMLEATR